MQIQFHTKQRSNLDLLATAFLSCHQANVFSFPFLIPLLGTIDVENETLF